MSTEIWESLGWTSGDQREPMPIHSSRGQSKIGEGLIGSRLASSGMGRGKGMGYTRELGALAAFLSCQFKKKVMYSLAARPKLAMVKIDGATFVLSSQIARLPRINQCLRPVKQHIKTVTAISNHLILSTRPSSVDRIQIITSFLWRPIYSRLVYVPVTGLAFD